MTVIHKSLWLVLALGAGCATVRPITYPSPCLDRYTAIRCVVTGYEVWGTPSQIRAQAKKCPRSAHVTIDPHRDYGVVRCYAPDPIQQEAPAVVVVEQEAPIVDMVVSIKEAVPPFEAVDPQPPAPEVRDQPRIEKPKTKQRPKRRRRMGDDD